MLKKCKGTMINANLVLNRPTLKGDRFKILLTGLCVLTILGLNACKPIPTEVNTTKPSINSQPINNSLNNESINSNIADELIVDPLSINTPFIQQGKQDIVFNHNNIAAPTSAIFAKPDHVLACNDIKPNQTIEVTGHWQLEPNCQLQQKSVRFKLQSANTSLDCNGAMLSPHASDTSNASAIMIQPKKEVAISNIGVANCHITGYGHALHIKQKSNPNQRYARNFINPDDNRAQSPQYIRVINLSSLKSKNSAIFVGDHVHHVNFDKLRVMQAGTVGLYFEFGSRYNQVNHSVFVDNGFRRFKPNREAIAIDSSSHNRIKNSHFIHNGAGSIHLYRNCFEHADDASRSNHFKRTESAAFNIIEENVFKDEPVGVWVASRQSRNLIGFECGAYPLAQTPFAKYHVDSAKNNTINSNTFINVDKAIIVEDDGTKIIENDFTQVMGQPIEVGSDIRQKYAENVQGLSATIKDTLVEDNILPQ